MWVWIEEESTHQTLHVYQNTQPYNISLWRHNKEYFDVITTQISGFANQA